MLGEVSLFDRGARSGTARAVTECVVHAIPFDCLDGRRAGLSAEARLRALAGIGAELAARVRVGGQASAEASRRGEAMGQFLVSVMTLQCIYAITLTALPHIADLVPLSTSYISIPLQLVFAVGGVAFILRTGFPLATFGLGLRDLLGSIALAVVVTAPFLGVLTGVKWIILLVKGVALPVIENVDVAAVVAQPGVQKLLLIYGVSCLVQEIIVRSALQSSLHLLPRQPARSSARGARLRAGVRHQPPTCQGCSRPRRSCRGSSGVDVRGEAQRGRGHPLALRRRGVRVLHPRRERGVTSSPDRAAELRSASAPVFRLKRPPLGGPGP